MSIRSVVALAAMSAVLTGCTSIGSSAPPDAERPAGGTTSAGDNADGNSVQPELNGQQPLPRDRPCMSLLGEVAADPSGGGGVRVAPTSLTGLARRLGPTVTYDFSSNGPVTETKSFAHRQVYAIVLGKNSFVDGTAVQRSVRAFHLGVPVVILKSCASLTALVKLRRQITAEARRSFPRTTMATGISTARGQVMITVYPRQVAQSLRDQYGDRVLVDVSRIYSN